MTYECTNKYTQEDLSLRSAPHPAHSRAYALAGLANALVVAARDYGKTRLEWTRVLVSGVLKFNRTHGSDRTPLDWLVASSNAYTPQGFDLGRDLLSRQLNVIDPPQANAPSESELTRNTAVCHRFLKELSEGPMGYTETREFYAGFEGEPL